MDNDVTRVICRNTYTLLSMMWLVGLFVVNGVSFGRNIIGLDRWINISLVIKFSLKIGMGMDNPVKGLTIK